MPKRPAISFVVVISFFLIFVSILIFRSTEQSGDSLSYASAVREGNGLAHPHHLIFNHAVRLFYWLLSWLHVSNDALLAGQIHNIFWGMVILVLLFFMVRSLMGTWHWAALAVFFIFSSWGFLTFATDVDAPMPSLGALVIFLAFVLAVPSKKLSFWNLLGLSLAWALAILYHQSNLIFFVPILYWVLSSPSRGKWARLLGILGMTSCLVLSIYLMLFSLTPYPKTISGLMNYLFRFKTIHFPGWGAFSNIAPLGVGKVFHSQLSNVLFLPKQFLIVLTPLMALFVTFLLFWHLWQVRQKSEHQRLRIFLVVWLLTYYAFFLWWLPGEEEYFFATLIPILLLTLLGAADFKRKARCPERREKALQMATAVLAVLLLTVNFFGSVLPRHRARGKDYEEAQSLSRYRGENTYIYSSYEVQQNLKYYFLDEQVIEDIVPLIYYYQDIPMLDRFSPRPGSRLLFPIETLSPGFETYGYSGFLKPNKWQAFLGYLLEVQEDASSKTISCHPFTWVSARRPYLMVQEERICVASWRELFNALQGAWQTCCPKEAEALRRWMLMHGAQQNSGNAEKTGN